MIAQHAGESKELCRLDAGGFRGGGEAAERARDRRPAMPGKQVGLRLLGLLLGRQRAPGRLRALEGLGVRLRVQLQAERRLEPAQRSFDALLVPQLLEHHAEHRAPPRDRQARERVGEAARAHEQDTAISRRVSYATC